MRVRTEQGRWPWGSGATKWITRAVWFVTWALVVALLVHELRAPLEAMKVVINANIPDTEADAMTAALQSTQSSQERSALGEATELNRVTASLIRVQNPPDCFKSRYLILDDFTDESGFGFGLITIYKFLYVAHLERRVLLFLSSLGPYPWRWCHQPPRSMACFFEESSYCAEELKFANATGRKHPLPPRMEDAVEWNGASTLSEPVVIFRQRHIPPRRPNRRALYRAWQYFERTLRNGLQRYGRFFYYAAAHRVLFRPRSWVERAAVAQRQRWHLQPGDRFVVVHARHGSKHTEQRHIPVPQLMRSALGFSECLDVHDALLVTETQNVTHRARHILRNTPTRVRFTEYERPCGDVWNSRLVKQLHLPQVNDSMIDTIAYHSVLNVVLARDAVAFVGTIQSAYLKLLVSSAYAWQGRPVSIHSLRSGWRIADGYVGEERKYWSFNASRLPHPCADAPLRVYDPRSQWLVPETRGHPPKNDP